MRIATIITISVMLLGASEAYAVCQEGATKACQVGGKKGVMECLSGRWTKCEIETPPTRPEVGQVRPKYYVLSVVYSPPGRNEAGGGGSVTYGGESSVGTSVSAESSFAQTYSIEAEAEGGIFVAGAGASAGFAYTNNTAQEDTYDLTTTKGFETTVPGPAIDGISHDHDLIWLWLNPVIELSMLPDLGRWWFNLDQPMKKVAIYVRELRDPSQMQPGTKALLDAAGITTAQHYQELLRLNPFSSGPAAIDGNRFQFWGTMFYKPPLYPNDRPISETKSITIDAAVSQSKTVVNEYAVEASVNGSTSFIGLFDTKIKLGGKWVWTNSNTAKSTSGVIQTASVTIDGPAYGYTGSQSMGIYYDLVYQTFMFSPMNVDPIMRGSLKSRSGQSLKSKAVTVVSNGGKYHTFTDDQGEFLVYGKLLGASQLRVDGIRKNIDSQTLRRRTIEISLP